jgi:nicotinate-nucleotide adenylyltransferase
MQAIAILGGTFDPVHIGHLRVAWEAAEALDAQVRLVPAPVPPHRPAPVASAAQRVRILQLALAGQDRLTLDTRELDRAGPSYTFDTLHSLRAEFGASRPLILLLGADAFAGLPTWHRWRELFELAHIVVLTRPGHAAAWPAELAEVAVARRAHAAQKLSATAAGHVFELAVTPLEISASQVRALLAEGRDPHWLLPEALLAAPELLAVYRPTTGTSPP